VFRLILHFESEAALADAEKFIWDSRATSPFASATAINAEGLTARDQRREMGIHIVRANVEGITEPA
jgi:hypothetical protein